LSHSARVAVLVGGGLGLLAGAGTIAFSAYMFVAFYYPMAAGLGDPNGRAGLLGTVLIPSLVLVGLLLAVASIAFIRMRVWCTGEGFEWTCVGGLRRRLPWKKVSSLQIGTEIVFRARGRQWTIHAKRGFLSTNRPRILRLWRRELAGSGVRLPDLGPASHLLSVPILAGLPAAFLLALVHVPATGSLAIRSLLSQAFPWLLLLLFTEWVLRSILPFATSLGGDGLRFRRLGRRFRLPFGERQVILVRRSSSRVEMLFRPVGRGGKRVFSAEPRACRLILRLLRRRSPDSVVIEGERLLSLRPSPGMSPDTHTAVERVLQWVRLRNRLVGAVCGVLGLAVFGSGVHAAILSEFGPPPRPVRILALGLLVIGASCTWYGCGQLIRSRTASRAIAAFRSGAGAIRNALPAPLSPTPR
jgi:hypothetical protein